MRLALICTNWTHQIEKLGGGLRRSVFREEGSVEESTKTPLWRVREKDRAERERERARERESERGSEEERGG
jgi:hypothetical protein